MPATPPFAPTSLPTDNRPRNAGSSMNDDTSRLDGVAKVTGRAKYSKDRYLPNAVYVGYVRCPWGSAELASCNKDAAQAVPGVLEVEVTGKEGKYHGARVGHVVAESPTALKRALRALACEWRRRPAQTRINDAMGEPAAPTEETGKMLAQCDHVLDAVYSTEVQTHSSLETHGACVDHRGDEAVVYSSTQGTFAARDGLDEAIGLPRSKYKVVCEYVGGGFGSKLAGADKEGVLAARIAAKYKRPAYLFENRAEEHLDTGNRPASRTLVKIGFDKDGTIKGGLIHTWGGVGVSRGGGGVAIPTGSYTLGEIQRKHDDVSFNAGGPRAFRAPGKPQAAFAEELMLDEIATASGVDPVALRIRLNTSDDRKKMLQQGADLIGWRNRAKTGSQTGVMRRGFGVGCTSWPKIPSPSEAEVVINRDGSVLVRTGSQDIGTGQRTAMGIVAADALGVPLSIVEVSIGDSTNPPAPGSGGSVTLPNTAPSMAAAGADAKAKLLELVARLNECKAEELTIHEGQILRHNEPLMTWAQACAKIGPDAIVGKGAWAGRGQGAGHSDGVQFVDLRVDTETGIVCVDRVIAIQSCGKVVCRKTAESQIIGGVIQGLSFALFENRLLDRQTGAMVNPNLEWYKIAGPVEMPLIEPILWKDPSANVRSLGEPPTVPTSGAIACAIYNAIGKPIRDLPITPEKILAALA